jgi:NitT/TauT family transport system ATP-binding protein
LDICRNEDHHESVAMPLLEVRDLDKTFTTDARAITALDRLSLSVDEHEFVSIVGPSGCGKSTFLHIVGGFEPATGGEVRLNGRPVGAPGPDRDVPGSLAVSLAHRH